MRQQSIPIGNQEFADFQKLNQGSKNFSWPLYDRCVKLCEQHQLYPPAFRHLRNKPQKPTSVDSALPFLTVDILKSILAKHSLKRSGKRQELENIIKTHLSFDDIKEIARTRFSESYIEWELRADRDKFFTLCQMINARAYFLYNLLRTNILSQFGYKLTLRADTSQDSEKLAQLLDETGYSTVLQNGQVHKLLPLIPGDCARIYFSRSST